MMKSKVFMGNRVAAIKKRAQTRYNDQEWFSISDDASFEKYLQKGYQRQEGNTDKRVYKTTMDLGQWMTMGLFQSSSSINLLENGDAFVASQISQHSDYFDPEIMHAAEEGMGLTLKLGIKLRTDPETVSQYAHTEMMNLLALLQSDSSKLQHTFTRGGSWGVLVKLNPTGFVTTTENGENDACVITSTNFMHQLKDFAKIFLPATVMCVLAFKMDQSLISKFKELPRGTGFYALIVLNKTLSAAVTEKHLTARQRRVRDTQTIVMDQEFDSGVLESSIQIHEYYQFRGVAKLLFFLAEHSHPVQCEYRDQEMRVGVSTGVPQNYCLQFWDAALNNVGSQCLMYLINVLHWRTDIRIDQVKSHIFTSSVAADRAIEFVRYHNVDLMDIASKKSTDIQSYNYEQLSGLKYEISDKLSSFTTDIQSEVYLCAGLLLQVEKLLQRGYAGSVAWFTREKNDIGLLLNLVGSIRVMRKIWHRLAVARVCFLQDIRSVPQPWFTGTTLMKILAWFEEFVRCMEHGSSSCLGVLALFAWPHAFQNSLSAKRDAESELNSMFGGGIEVMDGSILQAPHVFEGFKLVLFFSLYLRNSCHVLACEREEFARFADSIELVALARERKEQYDKINITGYSQFFDPVEWKTGVRASLYQNSNATVSTSGSGRVKTLTDFLDQIFSCERRKVGILIQSGPTNSGKSHSAHSWISLLYQLNGVFIGSSISSDFQRVSHLGVRHLRVVEEYKHNIIGDFHHLESNGKQLFSNNAVVPTRVSVAMLNCDKVAYSLDEEANLMALDSKNPRTKKEIQSRVAQVRSRLYVLDWTNAENSQFLAMSNKFRITCNRMSRVINNAIKLIRENRGESDLHHRVDVGMNEIILRWDLSTVSSMRYSQILQAYGDLGAWGAALNRIFSCLTKSYMYLSKYDIGTFAAKLDTLENLYVSKTRVPLSDEIIKCAELMIDEKTTFEGDLLDFSTGIADRVAKSVITSPVYSRMSYAGTECQIGKF